MKKFHYSLLGIALLASHLSPAAADDAPVLGKAKDLQGAITACTGKNEGDSCFTTPVSKDGKYASMVALMGACALGKVDLDKDVQASVLLCQPKSIPLSGAQSKPKVVKSDASGVTAKVNAPADILTNK